MKKETKKLSQLTKTLRFQIASDGDQELSETIRAYIAVYNAVIDYSVLKNVTDPLEINKALYHRLRAQYPNLPCALQQSARNCACEAMKSEWTKAKNRAKKKKQPTPTTLLQLRRLPRMKITAAMRYTSTTLTLRGQQLTFSTNGKRRRVILTPPTAFQDTFKNWNCKSGTIAYRDGVIHINLTFKTPAPQILQPASVDQVIGCDAGIHHVLTLSSMLFFSAAVVRMLQRRYLYNRKTLQAKGTSSSRKRLKAIGQREQRFNRDVNHCISKKLIALPYNLYVLEKLNEILETKSSAKSWETGKKHGNKRLHSWSFAQLQFFITYKAMAVGKRVEFVNPYMTSQECCLCGKKGPRHGSRFVCPHCRSTCHADANAAVNIKYRSKTLQNLLASLGLPDRPQSIGHMLQASACRIRYA